MAALTMKPATQAGSGARAGGGSSTPAPQPVRTFADAAMQSSTGIGFEETVALSSQPRQIQTLMVPPTGYLRHVVLMLELTPGGPDGVFQNTLGTIADVLGSISLDDVSGTSIVSPVTGSELTYLNTFGGWVAYGPLQPAVVDPFFVKNAAGVSTAILRIPLEIGENDGYGSLANMDSSQTYRVNLSARPLSAIYSTVPTGGATLTVRAIAESWVPPAATGPDGTANAQQPPGLGTTQFISKFVSPYAAGSNVRFSVPRTGNHLRQLHLWFGPSNGAANETYLPRNLRLELNGKRIFEAPVSYLRHQIFSRTGLPLTAVVTPGYVCLDWCHEADGRIGYENRVGYLHTATSDDLAFYGDFTTAGSVTMIVNDIAAAGVA